MDTYHFLRDCPYYEKELDTPYHLFYFFTCPNEFNARIAIPKDQERTLSVIFHHLQYGTPLKPTQFPDWFSILVTLVKRQLPESSW